VAERRRRGTNPADDRRAEELSTEKLDEELLDDLDADPDVVDESDEDDDTAASSNGRRMATKAHPKPSTPGGKSTKTKELGRRGIFARLINFVREVVAELRKVIWPTRKELLTYTAVVVVFVAFMLTIVGLLDLGFARAVLWVFGNKTTPADGGQ
jgi:preprotein translocase subunit SecE